MAKRCLPKQLRQLLQISHFLLLVPRLKAARVEKHRPYLFVVVRRRDSAIEWYWERDHETPAISGTQLLRSRRRRLFWTGKALYVEFFEENLSLFTRQSVQCVVKEEKISQQRKNEEPSMPRGTPE